jgi:hypothetical protein
MPVVKRHKRFQGLAEPAVLSRDLDAGLAGCESGPCCGARHFILPRAIVMPLWTIVLRARPQWNIEEKSRPLDKPADGVRQKCVAGEAYLQARLSCRLKNVRFNAFAKWHITCDS